MAPFSLVYAKFTMKSVKTFFVSLLISFAMFISVRLFVPCGTFSILLLYFVLSTFFIVRAFSRACCSVDLWSAQFLLDVTVLGDTRGSPGVLDGLFGRR